VGQRRFGQDLSVYNPANGDVIAQVAEGASEDIGRAVTSARKAFESGPWPSMTPSDRGRFIWKIGDLILQNLDELAELESLANGKPRAVAAVADVPLAAGLFHYMAGWVTKIEGSTIPISVPYASGDSNLNPHRRSRRVPSPLFLPKLGDENSRNDVKI